MLTMAFLGCVQPPEPAGGGQSVASKNGTEAGTETPLDGKSAEAIGTSCPGREPAALDASAEGAPAFDACALERQVHGLINEERRKQGLDVVEWNGALSSIALAYSKDMASRSFFSHYSPEGAGFSDRYAAAGFECSVEAGGYVYMGGENLFRNSLFSTATYTEVHGTVQSVEYDWTPMESIAQSIVAGWMESPGHRKNILEPHWESEGIGVAVASDYKVYITENFC